MPQPGPTAASDQPGDTPGGSTDQGSGGTPPDAGGATTKRLEALEAQLKERDAFVEKLKAENADHRKKRRDAEDEDKKRRGEFEPMLAERDKRIAELEAELGAAKGDADSWRSFQKDEADAIAHEAKAAKLDEATLDDLAAISDLRKRRRMLERLKGAQSPGTAAPGEIPAGSPGTPTPGSRPFHQMTREERAKASRPNGAPSGFRFF